MSIFDQTLRSYLEDVAAKSPTPGGGCVSAVTAANAAAMVGMVARLTQGKKGYEEADGLMSEILAVTDGTSSVLESLAERDMAAFAGLMTAWRLPDGTPEEKAARRAELAKASRCAAEVPLEIGRICLQILRAADRLAPAGNKTALSDVGVGVYLAEAALHSALLTLEINLPALDDPDLRQRFHAERAELLREAAALKESALAAVRKRL